MARIKFDLETYKAHPEWKVETRNGWPARILCHDRRGERPLVVLVQQPDGFDDGRFYYESGLAEGAGYEMDGDLFLVTPEIPKSPNNIDEEAKQIAYNVCKDLPNGPWDKGYQPTDERKVADDAKTMDAICHLTTRGWTCITPDGIDVTKLQESALALVEAVERYVTPKKGQFCHRTELLNKVRKLKELL